MPDLNYIICVPWGQHGIPSVKRVCVCGVEVALSQDNVTKADSMNLTATAICPKCGVDFMREPEQGFAGGLVGGKVYPTMAAGLLAAVAAKNRN